MEYNKSNFERDVRSRYNKLRQTLRNTVVKGNTKHRRYQRQSGENHGHKASNECDGIKVKETYDKLLDLRNTFLTESSDDDDNKRNEKKTCDTEQKFLDKVCEIPNMHYKILTLCSVKNSSRFSEQFNVKTNIISERIVNKQLELQAKPPSKPKPLCKILPKIGEKTVIQKIIEKEKELQQNNPTKKAPQTVKSKSDAKMLEDKGRNFPNSRSETESPSENKRNHPPRPRFQLSTKPDSTSKIWNSWETFKDKFQKTSTSRTKMPSNRSNSSSLEIKKSNISKADVRFSRASSSERCKPRFLLSTQPTRRCAVSHSSVQVTMEKSSACIHTQTENLTQLRSIPAQTYKKNITNAKKMQTRLCKTYTTETNPILIENPVKGTSTTCDYYRSEQPTQMYEHLTTSDLVCLDWVNRHLFGVNVNPYSIIVDDKIKEVSEIASKSTFLSEEFFTLLR